MILRFKRGTAVLDLSTAPYSYGADFAPPATAYAASFATGTAVNAGGNSLITRQATIREWSFQVLVTGTTQTGIETSIEKIEQFLALSALSGEDTYLEYSSLDIPEPCTGWFGAVRRYKILSASTPVIGDLYGNAIVRESAVAVTVSLTIDAYATGPARRMGEAEGTITETVGADGLTIGVAIGDSAKLRIPVAVGVAEQASIVMAGGAALVVWKTGSASNATGNRFMFSCGNSSLRAYYNATDDKMYLTDNTNSISTAAQTFASGDTVRWLFTWGATNKLKIYKNGVQAASGNTHTAPSAPTYIYMGTDASENNIAYGTMTLTVWPAEPTAAQVAAIDAEAAAIIAAGGRVDYNPWFSTRGGDNVLDPYLDADQLNYGVVAGIPGSAPAKWRATITAAGPGVDDAFWCCYHNPYASTWDNPATCFYVEGSGTAETGNSNNDYTGSEGIKGLGAFPGGRVRYNGVGAVARMRGGTSAFTAHLLALRGNRYHYGPSVTFTPGAAYKLYYVPPVFLPEEGDLNSDAADVLYFDYAATPTPGQTHRLDYVLFLPMGETLRINAPTVNSLVGYMGHEGFYTHSAFTAYGTPLQLLPGHRNTIMYAGADAYTFLIMGVIPSWGLL